MVKKLLAMILTFSLIAVQIMVVFPVLALDSIGNGELISKFTEYDAWYNKNHGYSRTVEDVTDNYNFTSAFSFKITDSSTYSNREIYFYRTTSQSIADWASNPEAEMRLWVKSTTGFTTKLSVMCYTGSAYPHAYKQITVPASNKWQEIRLKRSDFTADSGFNTGTAGSFQYCTIRFQTSNGFVDENETIMVGPAEFYDGKIATEIDPDGGTIISGPKEGNKIATFKDNCWYDATNDGFSKTVTQVDDNSNFTSALNFEITNRTNFDKVNNRNVSLYENKNENVLNWVKTPYAEMRFWIRSTVDFSTTLSVMTSVTGGYPHISKSFSVTASDKWQEIRIKSEDFTGDRNVLIAALEGTYNYTLVRFMTSNGFIAMDEKIEISPIEFYDGYIAEAIDPEGGTINTAPQEGEKIATFKDNCWYNASSDGFSKVSTPVTDNTNFTSALNFEVTNRTDFDKVNNRNVSLYENKNENVVNWVKTPYAEMRFWIRSTVDFDTTLSVMTSVTGAYPHISKPFSVTASDKWQEIRIRSEDFTGDRDVLISALEGTYNYTLVRFMTSNGFIDVDEKIEISPIEFYDGYIAEAIDPEGGTIITSPVEGEKIATFKDNCWYSANDGISKEAKPVDDNKNFNTALNFKITDRAAFDSVNNRNISWYETKTENIVNWVKAPYAEMRFWIRSTVDFTTTLSVMASAGSNYPHISKEISVTASEKWQEIRIKSEDFTGDKGVLVSALEGTYNYVLVRFMTSNGFIDVDEKIEISPIEFYDGYIKGEIDPDGGTIIVTPEEGEKIATFKDNCWYSANDGYSKESKPVEDNKNFTSALNFKITDRTAFDSVNNRNISWYETKSESVANWVKIPYAEMRFWIRSTVDFTTTLSVMASAGNNYPHISKTFSVTASEKWQEIRIKSEDFSGDASALITALEGSYNYALVRFMTSNGFIGVGEKIEISPIEFYDGYIKGEIDPEGGTVVIVPKEGKKIADFNTECWNSSANGYTVTGAIVDDNSNFKKSLKFNITNKDVFNTARDRNAYLYENKTQSISDWVQTSYAEMRFWVKTSVDFTTSLDVMCYTGKAYPHITAKISVKASDKWQEIRVKSSDFTGDSGALLAAFKGEYEYAVVRLITTPDFIAAGKTIEISPMEFYDGYIKGKIDPEGGTIVVPDIYGKLKATMPPKVINSFKGLQTKMVNVTDNEFFSTALKLTATDLEKLYEKRQHVYTNETSTAAPINLSEWYNYSKAEMRLWVKVPHSMKITLLIVEQTPTAYPYISTTLDVEGKDGWQELRIPRSAFSSNPNFTGEYVKYLRILTPEGADAKSGFLDFCESMYVGLAEFYNGIIPASANKVDKGEKGKLITTVNLKPANVNGSVISEIDVKNNSNFKKAVSIKVDNARTFASGEMSHYIHLSEELIDITKWYNNPNAEVRFWVLTEKDVVLRFGFQNPFSKTPSSYRAIWGQMSLTGSDKWQEVRIPMKNFSQNKDFDPKAVGRIKLIGSGDNAITTNETFYIGNVQIYDGYIASAIDKNGGTTSASKENAVTATFSSFTTQLVKGNISVDAVDVDTNKYFTSSVKLSSSGAAEYNVNLKTFYDLADISRSKSGTVRLWVMSGVKQSFNLVLTDKNGKKVTVPFTTAVSDKWQELRCDLKSVNTKDFDFAKLFSVSIIGKFGAKASLEVGKIELWKKVLDTEIEVGGGTLEPLPELPPVWETLPKFSGESEIFAKTATSVFWINDWNDKTRPRSITAYNRGLDNKDENYYRFTTYKEISVVEPKVYYENPTPAGFGFNEAVDMTPYLKTGTMRFWINVPKNMTVKVTLKSQVDGRYTESSVDIPLKKTTESGGFQEVAIPLKAFYDAAIKAGSKWNPYYIKHILIGGITGCNASTFLAKDELLLVSQFEFWKGKALEPPPYDPTRIFYSKTGNVFIKDVNEILAKTAMFSAYKETVMLKQYANIVKKYYSNATLKQLYMIELISADAYNYKRVGAYGKVSVYMPKGDLDTNNLSIAVYNSTGIHPCEFTVEDDYIVISTKEFGMFMFMSGGSRNTVEFNYKDDLAKYFKLIKSTDTANADKSDNWFTTMSGMMTVVAVAILVLLSAVGTTVYLILKKKGKIPKKG